MTQPVHCAIGDIHGELDRLKALHQQVLAFAQAQFPKAPLHFVHLGDLIDRGPDSCGVIDYLMDFERTRLPRPVTLRGNHEQMMIDAFESSETNAVSVRHWSTNGGAETFESYSGKPAGLMQRHLGWLKNLPTHHAVESAGLVFVHAGVDPDRYPACGEQVHMWTRRREFRDPRCWTAPALKGKRVIHGHTPTEDSLPESVDGGRRLNIDTGAVYGGRLTAVILRAGEPDLFFHS